MSYSADTASESRGGEQIITIMIVISYKCWPKSITSYYDNNKTEFITQLKIIFKEMPISDGMYGSICGLIQMS